MAGRSGASVSTVPARPAPPAPRAETISALGAAHRAALRLAGPLRGARVLSLGCGGGAELVLLARAAGDDGSVLGVDIDSAAVDRARRRLAERGIRNAGVLVGSAADPPRDAAPFDLVYTSLLTHHLTSPRECLPRWRDVASPRARLLCIDWEPHPLGDVSELMACAGWRPTGRHDVPLRSPPPARAQVVGRLEPKEPTP
jgi:SAM-dependent methyltransferase